jgi:CRP-like cAMP-binding protein
MAEDGADTRLVGEQGPQDDPLVVPRFTAEQLELLRRYGEVRSTAAGQVLFYEGDRSYDFLVILSGTISVVDDQAGVRRELATGGPGEFVADVRDHRHALLRGIGPLHHADAPRCQRASCQSIRVNDVARSRTSVTVAARRARLYFV